MKRYLNRFQFHGLFLKLFFVIVVSIVSVSVLITWSTVRISESLFIDTFSITNSKVMNQIEFGLRTFNDSIVTASNDAMTNGTVKQFLTEGDADSLALSKAYFNMSKQMGQIASNVRALGVDMIVRGVNGRVFATDRSNWPIADAELKNHPLTAVALREPKKLIYQFYQDPKAASPDREPIVVATKALLERTTGKVYGTVYFAIGESEFRRIYENYTTTGNDVVVLNKSGVIVSSNRRDLIGQSASDLLEHARDIENRGLDYKNARFMGKDELLLSDELTYYDMYLVNLIDKKWALGQLRDTKAVVLISVAIVAVALIIVFLITRSLTKSLTRLVKQIANISKYEFDHYVTVSGSYETRQLARAFNEMLDELHEYVEELMQTQKKQRNAELEALQRQINPHFLYNTLASVKIMVRQGSREKAAETINALISILQNAIGDAQETVTLEQELSILKHYVYINQVRYGDRIKVDYFVSPDCLKARVPKLMLQPFIENAFFHAFHAKPEGYTYVMASREGDTLHCEVADNGDGMKDNAGLALPNAKSKRQLFTGIGIRNVDERLKLLYGEPYGVTIASQPGQGTQVRIKLPFRTS